MAYLLATLWRIGVHNLMKQVFRADLSMLQVKRLNIPKLEPLVWSWMSLMGKAVRNLDSVYL